MSVTPKKPDPDKEILTPGEACWVIGKSWNTVRKLIITGDIPAKRLKRGFIFVKSDLIESMRDFAILRARLLLK